MRWQQGSSQIPEEYKDLWREKNVFVQENQLFVDYLPYFCSKVTGTVSIGKNYFEALFGGKRSIPDKTIMVNIKI